MNKIALPKPLETDIQKELVKHLQENYPTIVFKFDFLSGAKITPGLAAKAKRLGNTRAYPDLFIAAPRNKCHGFFLELKRDDTRLKKRDGEWATPHIAEQANMLTRLRNEGYFVEFAIGYDEATAMIDSYLAT